jgi:glycerophosphoryl diester phosphodiesterase
MKIIAHRGCSEHYPENSVIAFEKAIEAGVDMIETDVRLSRDDVPIIFHDANLSRISNRSDLTESQLCHELRKLDIGSWFHDDYKDLKLLTLAELLRLIDARVTVILEIKYRASTYKKLCKRIAKQIHDKLEWVEISSFDDKILKKMHRLNPQIRLHKLIDELPVLEQVDFDEKYAFIHCFDIEVPLRFHPKTKELMQGSRVILWTVHEEDISEQKALGLYGAMSNNPRNLMA